MESKKFYDNGLFFLRLIFGICFLMHGISKISHGIDFVKGMVVNSGMPEILSYGVYIGEVLAPICIIIGLFPRISSFIIIINSAMILFLAHGLNLFGLNQYGGFNAELPFLYIGICLCILFCGSGKYAIKDKF